MCSFSFGRDKSISLWAVLKSPHTIILRFFALQVINIVQGLLRKNQACTEVFLGFSSHLESRC